MDALPFCTGFVLGGMWSLLCYFVAHRLISGHWAWEV